MSGFVKHLWARDSEELPPITSALYEFVGASNGTFVRGKRAGLEVCMQIGGTEQPVRGLAEVEPYMRMDYPRVPAEALEFVLERSREVCSDRVMREILFHFTWSDSDGVWRVAIPEQDATGGHVKPLDAGHDTSYATSVLELHSHHSMAPFFSSTDDADEQGFKLYAVIGNIFNAPALSVRVGLYGYFWRIQPWWIFNMPKSISGLTRRVYRRDAEPEQRCRECGCTDSRPCTSGCFWVEDDLCSECAPVEALHAFNGVIDPDTDLWLPRGVELR